MGLKLQELFIDNKIIILYILFAFLLGALVLIASHHLRQIPAIQYACEMAKDVRPVPPPMICP